MTDFTRLLDKLAADQFKEGARYYGDSPKYGDRCNSRFQLLTDVSKFLKGNK